MLVILGQIGRFGSACAVPGNRPSLGPLLQIIRPFCATMEQVGDFEPNLRAPSCRFPGVPQRQVFVAGVVDRKGGRARNSTARLIVDTPSATANLRSKDTKASSRTTRLEALCCLASLRHFLDRDRVEERHTGPQLLAHNLNRMLRFRLAERHELLAA